MAYYGPNAQRRYHVKAGTSSTTNLLGTTNPSSTSGGSAASVIHTNRNASVAPSILDKFSLSPDPKAWGSELSPHCPESDDYLHNPDPRRDLKNDSGGDFFTFRGLTNLGCIVLLGASLLTLFAGYPLISHFTARPLSMMGGFNIGGINATGQIATMNGNWGLIDLDTPQSAYMKQSYHDPDVKLQLVFSDEFNTDGRTFYPGDDPYWEAVDLHYWATNNVEWYDPAAIMTKNGALEVTLSRKETHGLHYEGGMMSSWNKFCFTGGLLETSVTLPGANNVVGLWPAIWTLGNLGRAGYGASLDGTWPYTYDSCDVGTAPNQTFNGQPQAATVNGDPNSGGALSYLPGQRLSRCTCPGESHPGPLHQDGTYVGRSSPEIDVFEAQVTGIPPIGQVSQSAQWAVSFTSWISWLIVTKCSTALIPLQPFNDRYQWFNTTQNMGIVDPQVTALNSYVGGAFQQATSGVTRTNQSCYELETACFSVYGFEYRPGFDNAYISWVSEGKLTWTLNQAGMAADERVQISPRPIPQEPLYLIINLGMSTNFGDVDLEHLSFPTTMRIDWIRVYQPQNAINIGCDPSGFPTQKYINKYIRAYTDANLTTWRNDFQQPFPKNKLLDQC